MVVAADKPHDGRWETHVYGLFEFSSTYAKATFDKGKNAFSTVKLIRKLDLLADSEIHTALEAMKRRDSKHRVDCRAGCNYCCHQEVTVSVPEAIAVYLWIMENCSAEEIRGYQVRSRQYAERYVPTSADRLDTTACPLLVDGLCGVFPARPLICRGYHSFDVERCQERFETAVMIDAPLPVATLDIAQCLVAGIGKALETEELPSTPVLLPLALDVLFMVPDAIDRFYSGDEVFVEAGFSEPGTSSSSGTIENS